MADNVFAQETLQMELELVRLHHKIDQMQNLERPQVEELLETISQARDRCDRFLERYTGSERRRVASIKNTLDEAYEKVSKPLLEGLENEVTAVTASPAEPAPHLTENIVEQPHQVAEGSAAFPSQIIDNINDKFQQIDQTQNHHPNADAASLQVDYGVSSSPPNSKNRLPLSIRQLVRRYMLVEFAVLGMFWVAIFVLVTLFKPDWVISFVHWLNQ